MLHWNLGKNSVTIVCGHQAIIIFFFFRHISCILFGSLSGFVLLHGRNSGSSWPPRLALISLLFIVHAIKLIAFVIPYLNLSPELD